MTLRVLFFHVWSIKIAILFFDMAVKSYILWCSREYCAVPTFLRVFPVSTPYLSSSFKSIYCSQKSIRLSEERCRLWGYGSLLSHFPPSLPHTHICTYRQRQKKKKNCDDQGACVCVFWVLTVRKKCHTSLKKSEGKLSLFPGQPNQWSRPFTSSELRHKKHFYARSNHITLCHHPTLGQSIFYPQPHFLMLEIHSVSHKAVSPVNSIFSLLSSPLPALLTARLLKHAV